MTPSEGFASAARTIVASNIVHADFLADASRTEVVDYQPGRGGTFRRVWSMLDDSAEVRRMPDLFDPEPAPKRDEVPVPNTVLDGHGEPRRAARPVQDRRGIRCTAPTSDKHSSPQTLHTEQGWARDHMVQKRTTLMSQGT